MKLYVLLPLTALVLSACSSAPRTPDYACPLDDAAGAKCASVDQAYRASRSLNKEDVTRVQSVFDRRVQQTAPDAQPFFNGQPSNYPEPGQNGMPVFQQPKVMRVWVAPYVDADGNLRSGEYTYFNTPGQWSYGDLKKPGAAAGVFEPAKPGNLGFTPVLQNKATSATPPKPAEPAGASQGTTPVPSSAPTSKAQLPSDPTATITQPYTRLNNK